MTSALSAANLTVSVVPEAMHEVSRGHLKVVVSAQKAIQGSETKTRELLEVTEGNSVSQCGVIDLPSRQINDILQKGNRKKLN